MAAVRASAHAGPGAGIGAKRGRRATGARRVARTAWPPGSAPESEEASSSAQLKMPEFEKLETLRGTPLGFIERIVVDEAPHSREELLQVAREGRATVRASCVAYEALTAAGLVKHYARGNGGQGAVSTASDPQAPPPQREDTADESKARAPRRTDTTPNERFVPDTARVPPVEAKPRRRKMKLSVPNGDAGKTVLFPTQDRAEPVEEQVEEETKAADVDEPAVEAESTEALAEAPESSPDDADTIVLEPELFEAATAPKAEPEQRTKSEAEAAQEVAQEAAPVTKQPEEKPEEAQLAAPLVASGSEGKSDRVAVKTVGSVAAKSLGVKALLAAAALGGTYALGLRAGPLLGGTPKRELLAARAAAAAPSKAGKVTKKSSKASKKAQAREKRGAAAPTATTGWWGWGGSEEIATPAKAEKTSRKSRKARNDKTAADETTSRGWWSWGKRE